VIEELRMNKDRYKLKRIEFWDDIFTFDKKWLKEFLDVYKREIALPFRCYIHVSCFDEDIAKWLKEAGCKWVDFGIQSINENYRRNVLKRFDKNEDIVKAINLLKKYRIVSFADYIIGLPGDSKEHFEQARLFFIENKPNNIEPYFMSYLPHTEILETALSLNVLDEKDIDLVNNGTFPHNYFSCSFAIQDKRFYENYYFIFKVLPATPNFLKKKIDYKFVNRIPGYVKRIFELGATLYLGFKYKNIRVRYILNSYPKHFIRIVKIKCSTKRNIHE